MQKPIKAGKEMRMANYGIDIFCIAIMTVIASRILSSNGVKLDQNFLFLIVHIWYYSMLESISQKTIGKYITRTSVVTLENKKPEVWRICVRSILRLNPLDWFSYMFGSGESGTHDYLSKTMVVMNKEVNNEHTSFLD